MHQILDRVRMKLWLRPFTVCHSDYTSFHQWETLVEARQTHQTLLGGIKTVRFELGC